MLHKDLKTLKVSNLRAATPATVSRAGILYINPGDLGWQAFVTSWIGAVALWQFKCLFVTIKKIVWSVFLTRLRTVYQSGGSGRLRRFT